MNKSIPMRTSLTSAQLRAGRALIRWSAEDLARASAVGLTTIRRAELTDSETSIIAARIARVPLRNTPIAARQIGRAPSADATLVGRVPPYAAAAGGRDRKSTCLAAGFPVRLRSLTLVRAGLSRLAD